MTNEEILKKAIEKAVKSGYKKDFVKQHNAFLKSIVKEERDSFRTAIEQILNEYDGYEAHDIEHLIFSHDFAKAFWGEESYQFKEIIPHDAEYFNEKEELVGQAMQALLSWEYHLQQMVLEEDPIKYLEKFL